MFKVNNKDTRIMSIDVVIVSLMLTRNKFLTFSGVSKVDCKEVNTGWVGIVYRNNLKE